MVLVALVVVVIAGALLYQFVLSGDEADDSSSDSVSSSSNDVPKVQIGPRNSQRRADLNNLHNELEVFNADNGYYPSGSDVGYELSSSTLPNLPSDIFVDPDGTTIQVNSDPRDANDFGYHYLPSECDGGECMSYILGAQLEGEDGDLYLKESLN